MGEVGAGHQQNPFPLGRPRDGPADLLAGAVSLIHDEDGNQVKNAEGLLEKGKLHLQGMLLGMGLRSPLKQLAFRLQPPAHVLVDGQNSQGCFISAPVVQRGALKREPMAGGHDHDGVKFQAFHRLERMGRHQSGIHVPGVRRNQGRDIPRRLLPGSTGQVLLYLLGQDLGVPWIKGSGHRGSSHIIFHGHSFSLRLRLSRSLGRSPNRASATRRNQRGAVPPR